MRMIIVLWIVLFMLAPTAANAVALALRPADSVPYQTTCLFVEPAGAGVRQIAVFLYYAFEDLTGVRFGIQQSDINWQLLSITSPYTTVGAASDMSIAFGSCTSPVLVATILYYSPGHSPCGTIDARPAAGFPDLIATRCDYSEISIQGMDLTINGVFDTPPGAEDPSCFCPPTPTQPSTWGQVKALYRTEK